MRVDEAGFEAGDHFIEGATEDETVGVVRGDGDRGVDASGDVLEQVTHGDEVFAGVVEGSGAADPDVGGADEGFSRDGETIFGGVGVVINTNAVVGETSGSGALGRGSGSEGREGEDREDMFHSGVSMKTKVGSNQAHLPNFALLCPISAWPYSQTPVNRFVKH